MLVPVNDSDALADAMVKILSDRELSSKISSNAHEIVNYYSYESVLGKWESFICDISGWSE